MRQLQAGVINSPQNVRDLHIVFGSGGMPAVMAGIGSALALNVAEITAFSSIGGASGGTIPAAILAAKLKPREYLPTVINLDFSRLIEGKRGFLTTLWAVLKKYRQGVNFRPPRGIWSNNGMRLVLDDMIPSWPQELWILSACADGQLLFTADGSFKYGSAHNGERFAAESPPVGTAIQASCAVPGLVDAVFHRGEKLVDGAFTEAGDVPVDVVWRHFPSVREKLVLAVDVGDDPLKKNIWLRVAFSLFGADYGALSRQRSLARRGLAFIDPRTEEFHSLNLRLSRATRWRAILTGFTATAEAIQAHSLATPDGSQKLMELFIEFSRIRATARRESSFLNLLERYMIQEDLYS